MDRSRDAVGRPFGAARRQLDPRRGIGVAPVGPPAAAQRKDRGLRGPRLAGRESGRRVLEPAGAGGTRTAHPAARTVAQSPLFHPRSGIY